MAEKNIGQFDTGAYASITHVVAVPTQGPAVDINPILVPKADFLGPTGDQGPEGPQGVQGIQGPAGAKGDKGDKGDTGDQGAQGPSGSAGLTGATGSTGAKGDKGDQGPMGVVPKTTISSKGGTAYTLTTADGELYVRMTNAASKTVTVDTNANQPMEFTPEGQTTTIVVENAGLGPMTMVAAGGVTFRTKAGYTLVVPQFGSVVLTKVGSDEWVIVGDLEPTV